MPMLASIIMPCRNEEKYIREALQTAFNNDLSPESFEVIVVDGCSTDRTGEILNELKEEHTHLQVLENPKQTVPYAMNMGIRAAQGEFVIRIDAHCEYPRNYFSELIKYHRELNAGNVGTVMESRAKHSSRKTESIARVLSDGLGVGNAFFRIGADEIREVDTVPFGCYRREIFEEIGLYDERLTKSQDFELNRRLKRHGGKIYLLPHLHIVYYVRDTLLKLFQKYYKNGMWNIIAIKYTGRVGNVALRNYVPFLFVLANILGVVGSVLSLPVLIAYLSGLGAYLLTILWRSVRIRTPRTSVFWTFLSFLTLHFSHGIGGLVGLLRFPFIKQDHHRAP
jgi:glycosyltransferase involved in cell wall biosynthesis